MVSSGFSPREEAYHETGYHSTGYHSTILSFHLLSCVFLGAEICWNVLWDGGCKDGVQHEEPDPGLGWGVCLEPRGSGYMFLYQPVSINCFKFLVFS